MRRPWVVGCFGALFSETNNFTWEILVLSRLVTAIALLLTFLLSACSMTRPMALSDGSAKQLETGSPIFLLTTTLRNVYRPSFQPEIFSIRVDKIVEKSSSEKIFFSVDTTERSESSPPDVGNSYLLRMQLEQGKYEIIGLASRSGVFPISARFFTPLHVDFEAARPGIFYLGHVDATVRERNDDEFKAGPTLPLIDQSVGGASGGTFDVEVTDQWQRDEPRFRARFPGLREVKVEKAILPAFDRAKAQRWWEN